MKRLLARYDVALLKLLGTSTTALLFRTPLLVLRTRGRVTGRWRETPLAYHRRADGTLLVAGGAGGQRAEPQWVRNLRAIPEAEVVVRRRRIAVVAGDGERDEAVARWPRIEAYERRSGRPTPVFVLTPR